MDTEPILPIVSPPIAETLNQTKNKWKTAGLVVLGLAIFGLIMMYWVGFLLLVLSISAYAIRSYCYGTKFGAFLLLTSVLLLGGSVWGFNSTRLSLRTEEAASVAQQRREDAASEAQSAAESRRVDAQIAADEASTNSLSNPDSSYTSRSDFEQACNNLVGNSTDGEITNTTSVVTTEGGYAAGVQVDGGADNYGCAMDPNSDQVVLIHQ
jgi:hypothetical protein